MQTTKLEFTLSESGQENSPGQNTSTDGATGEAAVSTPDTGFFNGLDSVATQSLNMAAIILPLLLIVGVVAARKTRRSKFTASPALIKNKSKIAPILLITILLGVTASIVHKSFADDVSYANISAPATLTLDGELGESTFSKLKIPVTLLDAADYGYELYTKASDDTLTPKTADNTTIISSIAQTGALAANTYGYTLNPDAKPEDEAWQPLTSIAALAKTYTAAVEANTTTDIYLGIFTDNTAAADVYELDIDFYGTLTPKPISSIDDIFYMQTFAKLTPSEYASVLESMDVNEAHEIKDARDDKTYRIAKMSNGQLYMLDNLKLDATDASGNARKLTSADSDIAKNQEYTMPTEEWPSDDPDNYTALNYFCKATMAAASNGEYYYNWYAAKANPNQDCDNPNDASQATEANDNKSLGSICPAGWTLPSYTELTPEILWDNGNNPAQLQSTQGYVGGVGVVPAAGEAAWQSANTVSAANNYALALRTTEYIHRGEVPKQYGFSVRCRNGSSAKYQITFDAEGGVFDDSSSTYVQEIQGGNALGTLPTPTREGYFFKGWYLDTSDSWSQVYANTIVTDDMTVHALWGMTISLLDYMQDFYTIGHWNADDVVFSMEVDKQYQLIDNRDNKSYYISKIQTSTNDYEVWMTQNLDHDIVTTKDFYTKENTNINDNPYIYAPWTSDLATYTKDNTTWYTKRDDDSYMPESYDPGNICWNGVLTNDDSTATLTNNTRECTEDDLANHRQIGNYYSWTAAIASNNYRSGLYQQEKSALSTICPAGWTLPGMMFDFQHLVSYHNLTAGMSGNVQNAPIYFVYGGDWTGSSSHVGTYGYYPTNQIDWIGSNYIYAFRMYNQGNENTVPTVDVSSSYVPSKGLTVRCIMNN